MDVRNHKLQYIGYSRLLHRLLPGGAGGMEFDMIEHKTRAPSRFAPRLRARSSLSNQALSLWSSTRECRARGQYKIIGRVPATQINAT
eukprot:6207294-Pleurochrysis_carterae.AAC.3